MMPIVSVKYRGTDKYDRVREILIDAARRRTIVYYSPAIIDILGIEPGDLLARELGQLLGEISEDEHLAGRPMLSAVAIGSQNKPGKGFFTLARDLKKPAGSNEDEFWQRELTACYNVWSKPGSATDSDMKQ